MSGQASLQPGKAPPPTVKNEKPQPAEQEVFAIMDRRDEDQIIRQLQGEIVDEFFYTVRVGNTEKPSLSWVGVKACAQRMGNIKMDLISEKETDTEFRIMIKATDVRRNVEMIGASTQSKTFQGKPDQFAYVKCLSKAQRNALRSLLPEKMIATMLKKFRELKK